MVVKREREADKMEAILDFSFECSWSIVMFTGKFCRSMRCRVCPCVRLPAYYLPTYLPTLAVL